ncbi:hypothetical protein RND81_03G092200 [Saponaria officinalis]|uniref:protein disulfide-isomerase n=1 Tax=Saponaria officinalis TaxID=3572 RepID=A0AAW1M4V9_SAPOF
MAATKSLFILILALLSFSSKFRVLSEQAEYGSFEDYKAWDNENSHDSHPPAFDEKDVVILDKSNFADLVNNTKHVMVEFHASWCGYCQSLAPEYAAAATELKEEGSDVVLAKVDAIEEIELADAFKIGGFPTLYLFSHGQQLLYEGQRTKDAIVSWLKKKIGVLVQNVTSTEEAIKIIATGNKLVLAFVSSLTGSDSLILEEATKVEDEVNFYQTMSPDVAKIFEIDPKANRPALVLIKKEVEKLSVFGGSFSKSAIIDFVITNKHPLVINFSRETDESYFGGLRNARIAESPCFNLDFRSNLLVLA